MTLLKEKLTRELLDNPPDGAFILVSECGDLLHIKVADIIPKLTFLGNNLDEAIQLQKQHEELYRQIQEMPSPISEFYHKVQEKISSNNRIDPNLVLDMAKNLEYIWQDILRILQIRRVIINLNVSFFERLGQTYGKMSALEVACNDTMIVMETEAVKEFLEKFKTLRQEMLASVMETLSEGNQLLDQLYSLVNQGTLDSRPDFIKQDALTSVQKVEQWLENLHDKRNNLEIAWQNRRAQLEQCLELTLLNEAIQLQKQHEELYRQIQEMPSPISEFYHKVQEKISSNNRIDPNLVLDMAKNLEYIWQDILRILQIRRVIINLNVSFFERLGQTYGKMSALEVACNDTMIVMETEAVKEFLEKFKTLRQEMLASVMETLSEGNQLLDQLYSLVNQGTLDSRPDFIKQDALTSVQKVEQWLENLHDKRNNLEIAWQNRRAQLEQCLELTLLSKDLLEIENQLNQRKNDILGSFTLGESEHEANNLLEDHKGWKQDAAALRDKALKVTKAVEEIVNNDFVAGEEVSKRAYSILNQCNEYFEEIERRETLLEQSKHFFNRAEKVLESLEKQEIDILNLPIRPGSPHVIPTHIRMLDEIKDAVGEALNLGYSILDDVGPTKPEVYGVQKAIEKIEARNSHIETLCQINSEKYIKISEALNKFLEKHNELFNWLEQQKTDKIIGGPINHMGTNLKEARDCLNSHSNFLADLEDKGNEINNLLGNLKSIVEFLDDNQRQDVDRKIESLRKNWIDLKNFVLARVDVIDSYIHFHEITEKLNESFGKLENDIRTLSNKEEDVVDQDWQRVRSEFAELKNQAKDFDEHVKRVADPYLQTEAASSCIEKILNAFANRELDITKEWEKWNLKHEIEGILQEIIMANQETLSATSKIESQLYPVFNTDQTLPDQLLGFLDQRLFSVETDIQFADNELAARIEKLSKLESRDAETTQKIDHVRHNLFDIKHKLIDIRDNYKKLVTDIQEFLRTVNESRQQIHTYFTDKPSVEEIGIDLYSQEYEKFKYKTMESFRVLLQNSEVLIEKLKKQEPQGAKEHDTDRILTVLEQLRTYFEGLCDQENAKIRKLQTLEDYKKAAQDIRSNIEDLDRQLENLEGNYGDTSASAKAISLSFEYFERKIESLGKNIENLKNTSKNIIGTYPDLDSTVTGAANGLKHSWDELKEKAKKARKLIDLSIEYFNLIDQIETGYRRHSTYLVNMSALADQINTPESGEHLSRELEKYINEHEQPQLNDLKNLAGMSQNIYNEDRTVPIHTENITLFQQFHRLKADIDEKVELLKEQEAKRMEDERRALEEQMRQAELERQYKILLDQIDSATRRFQNYLANVQELANGINVSDQGDHLLEEVAKYIQGNEEPQFSDLEKLKEISMNAFNENRSEPINKENVDVFNALRALQSSLGDRVAQLKAEEAQKAEDERRALEEKMRKAELERDYQNLVDQIENGYRRNQTYLINTGDLAQQISTPESGEHLSKEVEKYLLENEPPQLADIEKLSEVSLKAFNEDRSGPIKTENVDLFDRLKTLKANIDNRVDDLKEQERIKQENARKALEEELKRKELERQYLNLLDQIDAAYRRHKKTLENLAGLSDDIKNPEAGQHLILELEKYLEETEQPQFNNLGNLAELSLKAYGEDRTEPMLANNVSVFEKLHNLRATIGDKIDELKAAEQERLERDKRALEEKMRKAELERQYQNLLDQIEAAYRQHNSYLENVQNILPQIKTPESGEHLSKELNKYICDSEQPQMDDLQKLSEMSNRIYGEDKTTRTHSDNLQLFQNLHKIKADIDQKTADLLAAEKEKQEAHKRALEEQMKKAEMERQYNNLVDQIEAATRRHHTYLGNVKNLASMIKTPEAGEHLARELQKYIDSNEQPQWDDLRKLAEMSNTAYGEDRTGPLYNENIGLFEEFHKLKGDIDNKVKTLREEEAEKMEAERRALEAMMKAAEDERALLEEQRRKAEEQRRALEEQRKNEQAQLALLEEQRRQEEEERLALEEQRRREQAQLALLEQQKLKEQAERDRYEEERKRKELEHAALEEQKRKEEAMRFASYEPPSFEAPLGDATVTEGDKFMFECHVKGFPDPTVQWYKDGIPIAKDSDYKTNYEAGVCTLQIDETFTADTAIFTCKASNSVGVAETAAKLFVRETSPEEVMTPPMFVKPLQSGTAREGATFVLKCVVTGNPLPTVQWFKNDINVDNSPDYIINYNNGEATLKFEEVFLEDQAVFKCKATNSSGMEETIAQLTVEPLEPTEVPSFRVPLSNVMARVGQKLKLECEVVGIPTPEVYWLHNDKPLTRGDVKLHYENEKATLVINEAFLKDAGVYTITAKNIAGEVSSASSVCVKGKLPTETSDSEAVASDMEPIKPSVQLPLKNVAVFEGKPVRLDCVIIGVPEPEVIWYHNERPVKESQDVQLLFQGDRCSLVINEAYLEDAGEYKVFAINSAGEASSHCTLSVTPLNLAEPAVRKPPEEKSISTDVPPKFEKLLTDVLCVEGDFIELECTVFGSPQPEIKWCLNNKDVIEDQRVHTLVQADGVVRLKIEDARLDDKGVYTVKATNSAGEAKCFAHLIVKPIVNAAETQTDTEPVEEKMVHPSFKELFADITAPEGGSAKFECIVMGRPTPKVKWLFNDQPIQGKDLLPSTSGDRHILFIPETSKATVGKISCVAENEVGRAVCIAYLQIVPSTLDVVVPQPTNNTTNENNITNVTNITNVRNINEYITSTTNKVIENGDTKHSETHTKQAIHDQMIKSRDGEAPVMHEMRHLDESRTVENAAPKKPEEEITIKEAKDVQDSIIATSGQISTGKPARKSMPPRLTSPFVGKIVDQHKDVVFEATFDGFPTPTIEITKNGNPLEMELDRVMISRDLNTVKVELKNVNVNDAGRYSCTVTNPAGSAGCTADLVVKKHVLPPVFCHRLASTIVTVDDRLNLDVTITGIPEPTVTWFKDEIPLKDANLSPFKQSKADNSYKLTIEHAQLSDAGKYMVRATNAGGEARSIADIVILEKQAAPEPLIYIAPPPIQEPILLPEPPKLQQLSYNAAEKLQTESSQQQIITQSSQISQSFNEIKMTTQKLEPNLPLKVDVSSAVEYGFAPKPMTPQTPTKGARLQGKIKALEEAQKEKGDVLVQGGIRVLPQMSVNEDKKQTITEQTESHEKKVEIFEHREPLYPIPAEPFIPESFAAVPEKPVKFENEQPLSYAQLLEVQAQRETPASYEVSIPASSENEFEQHLSTTEKRHLFEQKIREVQQPQPVQRSHEFVPLYEPQENVQMLEQEELQRMSLQAKREMFEGKIREIEQSTLPPLLHKADLTSPNVVRQIAERPLSQTDQLYLEPGTPPEICFAPQFDKRVESQKMLETKVEKFEKQSQVQEKVQVQKPRHEPISAPPVQSGTEALYVPEKQIHHHHQEQYQQEFGYRHVQPPQQQHVPQPSQPVYQPQMPFEQESVQIFKPIPQPQQQQPKQIPPQVPQKPVKQISSGYQADTEESHSKSFTRSSQQQSFTTSTHQKLVQHHHSYKQYQNQSQQQQPMPKPQPPTTAHTPKLVKPIPINAAAATTASNVHTSTHHSSYSHSTSHHQSNQKAIQREMQQLEPMPFKPEPGRPKHAKVPPPPSPSKFIKGEFHESDYESDVSLHYPTRSQYKPVRPVLTPTAGGRSTLGRTPTPPTEFDRPPTFEGPPRPKFQPIEKQVETKQQTIVHPQVVRPKPMPAKPVPVQQQQASQMQQKRAQQHQFEQQQRIQQQQQFEQQQRLKQQQEFEQQQRIQQQQQFEQQQRLKQQQEFEKQQRIQQQRQQQEKRHEEKVHREIYHSEPVSRTFYTAVAGVPQHLSNAVATETSKHMQMKESTEKSQRTVNVTHTRRVIALDDHQKMHREEKLEPFPYTAPPVSMKTRQRVPPPPTPTKFIPGEFRESDYESEVESARIRPLWTPNPFDEHDVRYRPVRPSLHGGRATSVPRSYERVMTPMEFDHGPIMPSKIDVLADRDLYSTKTQTLDRSSIKKSKSKSKVTQDDITIRNKYGSYKTVAQNQVESMSSQFKNKAHQFIKDIAQEQRQEQYKPVVKRASSVAAGDRKPQVYRDENRVSEYGTKQIDPDTGLIYFKYDFGYEFGIIFPGEGKRIVGGYRDCKSGGMTRNEISGKPSIRQAGDIEVPVLHEKSISATDELAQRSSKASKRHSLPAHFAGGEPHINVQDNSWNQPGANLRATPNTQVLFGNVVNQQEPEGPKKPPIFITPLKDIAAVSGQSARFECIVQCEPHPDIIWMKNGEIVQNTCRTVVEYRNGVCRLTIPQAYPVDAGQYSCTASNVLGSATTSAELLVPSGHHGKKGGFRK
uniref:CSON001463 protein n=1 Tax=Culicoides sonorensis TaxID=179676 RepID=A0A336ML28_CULSO